MDYLSWHDIRKFGMIHASRIREDNENIKNIKFFKGKMKSEIK